MARGKARELAFLTLFQSEQGKLPLEEVWLNKKLELTQKDKGSENNEDSQESYDALITPETLGFAENILLAFDKHRDEVDKYLQKIIKGWGFSQMAQTDLNILRLALSEILFEKEIPNKVTIEMAIRLAKKYGGEESGSFVNGVLARFAG